MHLARAVAAKNIKIAVANNTAFYGDILEKATTYQALKTDTLTRLSMR